jgi:cytochrome P450
MCVYGFLLAAQVNTYAVMGWTMTHLLEHTSAAVLCALVPYARHARSDRHVSEYRSAEAMAEQARVVRSHGEGLSLAALDDMNFLGLCILEAARLEIVGSTFRLALRDTQFGAIDIPRGHLVCMYTGTRTERSLAERTASDIRFLVSVASVHLNEDIFTEPLRYDPFRLMPGLPPSLSLVRCVLLHVSSRQGVKSTNDIHTHCSCLEAAPMLVSAKNSLPWS